MMPELKPDRLELPNGWYLLDFDPSVEKPRPWKIMRPNGDWLGSMIYGHEFAKAMATRPDGGDSLREALRDSVAALGLVKLYFEKMNGGQPVNDLAPHINSFFAERYPQVAALAAKDGE